jgi:hypothetical protein
MGRDLRPALAIYAPAANGLVRAPLAVKLLTLDGGLTSGTIGFAAPHLFTASDLPGTCS